MIVHELTTNAAKYGALSSSAGRIGIDWTSTGEAIALTWREGGGPRIEHRGNRGSARP
jgi:two-component sensor histidine kinase